MNYSTYMPNPYPVQQPYPPRQDMPQPMMIPPQMQQAPQQMAQPVQGLSPSSRPVTSREEATGVAADFSGSPMVFPDIAHNRVYIKRWNFSAGAADFIEYAPAQPEESPQSPDPAAAFAPLRDLQDLQGLVEQLRAEVDRLKKPAPSVRAVKKEKGEQSGE